LCDVRKEKFSSYRKNRASLKWGGKKNNDPELFERTCKLFGEPITNPKKEKLFARGSPEVGRKGGKKIKKNEKGGISEGEKLLVKKSVFWGAPEKDDDSDFAEKKGSNVGVAES